MRSDTLIRTEGMNALIKGLGLVEAEHSVMLIQKEPFDWKAGVYTPLLAAVQVTTLGMKVDTFVLGYDPRQYNKFPHQRRYPGGLPWGSSLYKWQENLFKDMTIDEIYNNAAELRQKK